MVGRRARRYGVSGKIVTLYVRFADFYSSFGKQNMLKSYINLSDDIFKAAVAIKLADSEYKTPTKTTSSPIVTPGSPC